MIMQRLGLQSDSNYIILVIPSVAVEIILF